MTEQEQNPIPEGSVITEEMVVTYQNKYPDVNRDMVISTLLGFESGTGELPADIFDGQDTRSTFQPLRKAYFAAKGMEEPEYSKVDEPLG